MRRLVDWLALIGVLALSAWACRQGDYGSGVLIAVLTVWAFVVRHRWRRRGETTAARLVSLIDER